MDIGKITAMLRMADPKNGGSTEERHNALRMAEKAMDREGLSYGSLGFSVEEARRIADQFSISASKAKKETSIAPQRPARQSSRSSGASTFSTPFRAPKVEEKVQKETESYLEQCERLDYERRTAQYNELETMRRKEKVEEYKAEKVANTIAVIFFIIVFIVIIVMLYMAGLDTVDKWLLTIGQVAAVAFFIGIGLLVIRFFGWLRNL